ncbi:MAG: hypothetical protein LBS32_04870, partial [Clostridiales Family XIII bacterium]|nr:hypothetical protein [Clostridiales Family XIII bacterium]
MLGIAKSVLRNLPFIIWLFADLRYLRAFRRNMRRFRAIGDTEGERGEILKATITWGGRICRKLRVDLAVEGETSLPEGPVVFEA